MHEGTTEIVNEPIAGATSAPGMPLPEYWEPRRVSAAGVRRMIEQLDPVEHATEITHLSQEVLIPPLIAYIGYAAGFARTIANPVVAHRIWRAGHGDQIVASSRRDLDTLAFFGLFMREGFSSPQAQAVYDRVQQIHRQVKGVGNETQLHVLGMLIFDQERADEQFGLGLFGDHDKEARFQFWAGVGRSMRLSDIPESRAEFQQWCDDYERRTFEPSQAATESFKGQLRGLSAYVPAAARPVARALLIEAVRPDVRDLLGFGHRQRGRATVTKALAKAAVTADHAVGLRLDRTWVRSFSRLGPDPDIHTLGYRPGLSRGTET